MQFQHVQLYLIVFFCVPVVCQLKPGSKVSNTLLEKASDKIGKVFKSDEGRSVARTFVDIMTPAIQKKLDYLINSEPKTGGPYTYNPYAAPQPMPYAGMPPPYYGFPYMQPPHPYGAAPMAQFPYATPVNNAKIELPSTSNSTSSDRRNDEELQQRISEMMEKNKQLEQMIQNMANSKNLNPAAPAVVEPAVVLLSTSASSPTGTTSTTSKPSKSTSASATIPTTPPTPNLSNLPESSSDTTTSDDPNAKSLRNVSHLSESYPNGVTISSGGTYPLLFIAIGCASVLSFFAFVVLIYCLVHCYRKRRRRNENFRLSPSSSTEPFIGRDKGIVGFEGVDPNLNAAPYPEI